MKNKTATLFLSFFMLLCAVIAKKKNTICARLYYADFICFPVNCTLSFDIKADIYT